MIGQIFAVIAAKGNGFAIGEMTGPGCERWHLFVVVAFGRPRLARDGRPL